MKPRRLGKDYWIGKPVCDFCQQEAWLELGGCKAARCDGFECWHEMREFEEADLDAAIIARIRVAQREAAQRLQMALAL